MRTLKHLLTLEARVRRIFSPTAMDHISQAVRLNEEGHLGEIRVVIEGALHTQDLWLRKTVEQRALTVFAQQHVWDTEHNTGVLIYLLLADRSVTILADRGINAKVKEGAWREICQNMEVEFRAGRFEEGLIKGIAKVGAQLKEHFPGVRNPNELPDKPTLL